MLRAAPILLLLIASAVAEPLALTRGTVVAMVEDTPTSTTINALPAPLLLPKEKDKVEKQAAPPAIATLRIEWLNQDPPPTGFAVEPRRNDHLIVSGHHLGRTGITRTLLATEEAVFLHIVADQPGAISFRASLTSPGPGKTTLRDRNDLIREGPGDHPARAFVRVIPFESDVEEENGCITLRGEGECLLIFSFALRDDPEKPVSGIWKRLSAALDSGAEHPDPVKIWQTISAPETAP